MGVSFELNEQARQFLAAQAQKSIETAFRGAGGPATPDAAQTVLFQDLGAFVTLTRQGALRGCIGMIVAQTPLYENVWKMARAAAFQDPRFPPLAEREWPETAMEISVLDQPVLCPDPDQIVIGRDGLILQADGRSGVFLPQVPVEQGWSREQYLEHLCGKAGLPQGAWRWPAARLYWYQAIVFPAK